MLRYLRVVVWLALFCRRYALIIFLSTALGTVFAVDYIANNLKLNTSTTDMLAPHLDFRVNSERLKNVFPATRDTLVVIVEADSEAIAYEGSTYLHRALSTRSDLFRNVFSAAHEDYFIENGLLFQDLDRLQLYNENLVDAQPFIATFAGDKTLRGLFAALELFSRERERLPEDKKELLYDIQEFIARTIEAIKDNKKPPAVPWSDIFGRSPDSGAKRFLLVTDPVLDFASLAPAAKVIDFVRQQVDLINKRYALSLTVNFSGNVALEEEEKASVISGATYAGLLAMVLVGFLVIRGLHSWRLALSVLLALLFGLIMTTAFATAAIGHLNLISTAFAVLFIGIGVDFGIQICSRYLEITLRKKDPDIYIDERLGEAIRSLGVPLGLAALAGSGGFFAFAPTDYAGMSELGIIAGGGLIIAFLTNFTLLPALLSTFCRRVHIQQTPFYGDEESHFTPIAWLKRFPIAITALGVTFLAWSSFHAPTYQTNFDPFALYDPDSPSVRATTRLLQERESQLYAIRILANGLAQAKRIKKQLQDDPQVGTVFAIDEFLPTNIAEKAKVIDDMAFFLLPSLQGGDRAHTINPERRRAAAQSWRSHLTEEDNPRLKEALDWLIEDDSNATERIEYALLRGLPLQMKILERALQPTLVGKRTISIEDLPISLRKLTLNINRQNIVTVLPARDVRNDPQALEDFVDSVRSKIPQATGAPVIVIEGKREVLRAFFEAGVLALVFVFILLLISLRNIEDSILAFVPLLAAAVMTLAVAVWLDLPLNFANIIALPLLFSLGVSYGIYLLWQERQSDTLYALMVSSTPRAILYSALTTMAGFGSLAISSHRGTASMGLMLLISLLAVLINSLIFLPAVLQIRQNVRQWLDNKA
ncbi:MAG: MMPL family transporter [Alphaproteobacteria bacterium GM202ARS2]|nr:MMPL family transporter [Alphaproteobacteria bacterium GM202ARS2]